MDESILHKAALRGDEGAWRVLYERHADSVYRFLYTRMNYDPARADDAFQETWMIAVAKLGTFDPASGCFDAWLKGIAGNVVRNRRRYWSRRNRTESGPLTENSSRETDATPTKQNGYVALALADLSPSHQKVLRERYYEGHSVAAIAERRAITYKAAESLLSRARAAFRDAYRRARNEERSG